jgi:hypothetical protein
MASNGSELRAFLAFLGNLWAVLAQASVLFPYASSFLEAATCCSSAS